MRAHRINLNRIAAIGLDVSNCSDASVRTALRLDIRRLLRGASSPRAPPVTRDSSGRSAFPPTALQLRGVKVLGGKERDLIGNSFPVAEQLRGVHRRPKTLPTKGLRVSEDIMVVANNITDVVRAAVSGAAIRTTAHLHQPVHLQPHNIIVRGNNLAQRTSGTDGLKWSALKLRGIAGENRQWRRSTPTGNVMFYDTAMSGEVFVGSCSAIRIEAPNALDRITLDLDENRIDGLSEDDYVRSQPANWDGSPELWAVPASPGEVSLGTDARFTGLDLRGFTKMRPVLKVGGQAGVAGTILYYRYSLDVARPGTTPMRRSSSTAAPTRPSGRTWQTIPPLLRQSSIRRGRCSAARVTAAPSSSWSTGLPSTSVASISRRRRGCCRGR